jgi:hypothetical protein
VGLAKSSVSNKIDEINDFISKCSDIPISEIPNKFQFLAEKLNNCSEFTPQLYNIWNKQAYFVTNIT